MSIPPTEADRNVAIAVAYKLAVSAVTQDDQYRHEAAQLVASHVQAQVKEARLKLFTEMGEQDRRNEEAHATILARLTTTLEAVKTEAWPISDPLNVVGGTHKALLDRIEKLRVIAFNALERP